MKKRFLAAALALAMLLMMVPFAFAASDGFDDVPGHWAEDAINRWSGYGVVNGVGDNQFAPNGTLTRAQAAQVFANLLDLEVQVLLRLYGPGVLRRAGGQLVPYRHRPVRGRRHPDWHWGQRHGSAESCDAGGTVRHVCQGPEHPAPEQL